MQKTWYEKVYGIPPPIKELPIIIPYKPEVHKGLELRYALRSIEKYFTGWSEVIVMGDAPEWYKGKCVLTRDYPGRKEYSIYSKILKAPVEGDFVFWNDDHFLLKYLHVSEMKNWHNGKLDADKNGGGRNRLSIQRTLDLLNNEWHLVNYDIHTPIIYNKEVFTRLFKDMTDELCIKSYYANQHKQWAERMEDCKISGWLDREFIDNMVKDRMFFSTGTICTPMVEYLQELFPEPSKFE